MLVCLAPASSCSLVLIIIKALHSAAMSQIPATIKMGSKSPRSGSTGSSPRSPATVVPKPRNSSIIKSAKKDKDQLQEPHIEEKM